MEIEKRKLVNICPYENNPRQNDAAVDKVAESIRQFGWRQPIVVDAEGVIICGHTRFKAAQKLGLKEAPVHVATDLTPEQIKAFRIADNKVHEFSTWNLDLLQTELSELQGMNVDLGLLGFSMDELANIFDPGVKDGQTDPDNIPKPPDEAITKLGDLWILGDHHLHCGDSVNFEDVYHLLGGARIHLGYCDPPYNVRVQPRSRNATSVGNSSFASCKQPNRARHSKKSKPTTRKMRAKDRPLENDFVSDADFKQMLNACFRNMARVLEPGRSFYIWGGYTNLGIYPAPLKAAGLYFSQGIVWDKEWPVLTHKDFMGAYEICFYGWREGAGHRYFGPNNATDLWHVRKVTPQSMVHLTEKPVELAVRAIQYSSRPGENVLDLFGGSGSTLIAAEKTGRKAFLMELDPPYCDVIVERWEKFTGKKAKRQKAGIGVTRRRERLDPEK